MLFEPEERSNNEELYFDKLEAFFSQGSKIWVSEKRGIFQGHVTAIAGQLKRNRHKISLVIGVLPEYQNMGLGGELMDQALRWCIQKQFHRAELSVMTHNKPAIALYEKNGFLIEGTIRHSLLVNGEWVDEYIMGRLL